MKFVLTIFMFLASASLALADFPSIPNLPKLSPMCTGALLKLVQDEELEKCLPIGQIVMGVVSGASKDSLLAELKGLPEQICPAPMCSDSLIKDKVNEASSSCSAELSILQMTSDQVADLVVQAYGDAYELFCYVSPLGEYCVVETINNLEKYSNTTPPKEVVCTPCNQAMYSSLEKLVNLVADSPIGKALNIDAEEILHEDELKAMCGDEFVSGEVPDSIKSPSSSGGNSSNSSDSGDGNSTSNGSSTSNGGSTSNGSKGDVGSETDGRSNGSNGSKGNNTNNSEADSAPVLEGMRSEYFVFSAIAMFAALL